MTPQVNGAETGGKRSANAKASRTRAGSVLGDAEERTTASAGEKRHQGVGLVDMQPMAGALDGWQRHPGAEVRFEGMNPGLCCLVDDP
jgi:hypothetical protein